MDKTITSPIEHIEARRISPTKLIRRSGILAIATGVSMVLVPFVHPENPPSAAWVPVHLVYFATLMGILLVLVGIFARQLQRAGRLGVAGFLTAFVGTAMMLLEGREHLFSHDFGQGTPQGLWELILASFIFSVGYILLGIAVARAGVLPRGAAILLAVGGPIVAFSPPIGVLAVLVVGHTLFGLGLAWTGYALRAEPAKE
ncbi:MAG: hypothetical protein M3392_11940 [Actinomycetota bacterium]|nr:hypothetical protein [Actinomycetota bacterium]